MVKRGIDILVAGWMLMVCFPVLLVCAILVKLDSHGPVLFRQVRMGRDFRPFQLLKLRTMRVGEAGAAITLGLDPRVTRIGRWLRRWKLDELPQLWNVLRGEMSVVGPRPVIPELTLELGADYRNLLRVRPGLTDPATIRYCRESEILSRVPEPMTYFKTVVTPEKLRMSRLYLRQATPAKDFGVMAKTVLALMSPAPLPSPAPGFETLPRPVSPVSMSQD